MFFTLERLIIKLPTDEKFTSFGHDYSEYCCCHTLGCDNIHHIFVIGHFSRSLWQFFLASPRVSTNSTPLRNLFMKWWILKHNNDSHRLMLLVISIFIHWNLLKINCTSKYGGNNPILLELSSWCLGIFPIFSIIFFTYIKWPSNLKDFIVLAKRYIHYTKVNKVY